MTSLTVVLQVRHIRLWKVGKLRFRRRSRQCARCILKLVTYCWKRSAKPTPATGKSQSASFCRILARWIIFSGAARPTKSLSSTPPTTLNRWRFAVSHDGLSGVCCKQTQSWGSTHWLKSIAPSSCRIARPVTGCAAKAINTYVLEDFDLLFRFCELFDRRVTTPHVLTEVSNLSEKGAQSVLRPFFEFLAGHFVELDEQYEKSGVLAQHTLFVSFGLVVTCNW